MAKPYQIIIVDDHPVVRKGIVQIVKEGLNFPVIDEVSDAESFYQSVMKKNYDLAILDISLPGRSGLDVLADVKKLKPELPVLVLSINDAQQYGVRALKVGASGYLVKDAAPNELVRAIEQILLGKKYISSAVAEELIGHLSNAEEPEPHRLLSERELEVFLGIAQGQSPKDIAEKLSVSTTTVSTYRTRILEKMNLKNNAGIIQYAMKKGLV
jgi:two-component system, NarL family, invasion response regulator UvrY